MTRSLSTQYGRSPWVDEFPKSRVPAYGQYRGALKRDVVIVGGGLTGCATAYAFSAAGLNVTLLEGNRLGRGRTAEGPGVIATEPDPDFLALEKAIGLRGARHAFQCWRRAALDFASLLRRLNVKCALEPRIAITVATDVEQASRLKREHAARRAAGIDAALLNARAVSAETGLPGLAGIRTRDGATLDPYRACLGLAAAAAERGAQICERSSVTRITFSRKWVDVRTATGTIRANAVVIATGMPMELFGALARHFWFHTMYLALTERVPGKVRHLVGGRDTLVRDSAIPSHLARWIDDERLLVSGADVQAVPPRQRDKLLVQRTGQLMYELSTLYPDISGIQPAYGWDLGWARTDDGLPYLGPHRNFPRHLFAFGGDRRSVTGAYLASRFLLRQHLREPDPADKPFEFARHGR